MTIHPRLARERARTRRLAALGVILVVTAAVSAGSLTQRQGKQREQWDTLSIQYGQKAVGFAHQEAAHRALAAKHDNQVRNADNYVRSWKSLGGQTANVPEPQRDEYEQDYRRQKKKKARASAEAERCRERAAYAAKMREKYEYAASHPWEPLAPDPPPP
jgi:hypothetical protein